MGSKPIGISASRGAAILGQSKYSEPVEAWIKLCEDREPGFCDANGYPKPEFVDNAATRWGNAMENKICEFAEYRHGYRITNREALSAHPEYAFITCHQDGEYIGSHSKTLHEGKTANERTYRNEWGEPGTEQIPRGYTVQVQHQMGLTGAEACIVSVLVLPKMQEELPDVSEMTQEQIDLIADGLYAMGYFHQYYIPRNQKLIDLMFEEYVRFWNEHVLTKKPPRAKSFEWLKKMCPEPAGTIIANEQVERWSTELAGWQAEKKNAESQIKQLKTYILDYMIEESKNENVVIDKDSKKRLHLMAPNGYKMHSFNGKIFR